MIYTNGAKLQTGALKLDDINTVQATSVPKPIADAHIRYDRPSGQSYLSGPLSKSPAERSRS